MKTKDELIAEQLLNAGISAKTYGSVESNVMAFGAVGNGKRDDSDSISKALASIPDDGGVLRFPAGFTYAISSPILLDKPIHVIMTGAVIKPLKDIDVFRTTGLFVRIEGGKIDGSNLISGTGCGVVVGYGGANAMQNRIKDLHILKTKGHGVKWEHGPYLIIDNVIAQDTDGDAFHFTANYDDNNHGLIVAHAINCKGAGYRVKHNSTNTNNSSRDHNFVYAKAFGCEGGGFIIETQENVGNFFLELNSGIQGLFTETSRANRINIIGVPEAYETISNLGQGNAIFGTNRFDESTYKQLQAETIKVRNTSYEGSLRTEVTEDRVITTTPTDTVGNVELRYYKGGASAFIVRFEDARFGGDGSPVYSEKNYITTIDFPAIAAQSTAFSNVNIETAITSDMVYITPVGGLEDGLVVTGAVAVDGIVQLKMHNYTASSKDPASRQYIICIRRTAPTVV